MSQHPFDKEAVSAAQLAHHDFDGSAYPHFDANGEDFDRTNAALQAAWDSMVRRGKGVTRTYLKDGVIVTEHVPLEEIYLTEEPKP